MDSIMQMIKAGLGIPPTTITPEYLLKMYNKGYNAALVDLAELVATIKQRYLDVLKDPDIHSSPEIARLCSTLINGICKTVIDNLNYKELPTNGKELE